MAQEKLKEDFIKILHNPVQTRFVSIFSHSKAGGLLNMLQVSTLNDDSIPHSVSPLNLFHTCIFEDAKQMERKCIIYFTDIPISHEVLPDLPPSAKTTDGAVLVISIMEEVTANITELLHYLMRERIKITLMIDGFKEAIFSLEKEAVYQKACTFIEQINRIIAIYPNAKDNLLAPENGTVAFGQIDEGWGFTLSDFAKIYSEKYKMEESKLVNYLWGKNYFSQIQRKWANSANALGDERAERGFIAFILNPIAKLAKAIAEGNHEAYTKMLTAVRVTLTDEEISNESVRKYLISKWLSCSRVVLSMINNRLPFPKIAQSYRCERWYSQEDACAKAIRECDPKGPLMVQIIRKWKGIGMVGRVLSGTLRKGQDIAVFGPNYNPHINRDFFSEKATELLMRWEDDVVDEIPCGNMCVIKGIDTCLKTCGTVADNPKAVPLSILKTNVKPIAKIMVEPKHPVDLPKLIEGLKQLEEIEPFIQVTFDDSGSKTIAGLTEEKLQKAATTLASQGMDLNFTEPVVTYYETVTSESYKVCLAKSPNKHNRLYFTAQPISKDLQAAIGDFKFRNEGLKHIKKVGQEQIKLWAFEPAEVPENVLIDQSKLVQYLNEIKDHTITAFKWVCKEGVLANESLTNVQYNIVDVSMFTDAIHRGGGQIIPTARRAFYASELTASPRLQEPVYLVETLVESDVIEEVCRILKRRNAVIAHLGNLEYSNKVIVRARLNVQDSFGLGTELAKATDGKALPYFSFDGYKTVPEDPLEPFTKASLIVESIRKNKGLPLGIPPLSIYCDKL